MGAGVGVGGGGGGGCGVFFGGVQECVVCSGWVWWVYLQWVIGCVECLCGVVALGEWVEVVYEVCLHWVSGYLHSMVWRERECIGWQVWGRAGEGQLCGVLALGEWLLCGVFALGE